VIKLSLSKLKLLTRLIKLSLFIESLLNENVDVSVTILILAFFVVSLISILTAFKASGFLSIILANLLSALQQAKNRTTVETNNNNNPYIILLFLILLVMFYILYLMVIMHY